MKTTITLLLISLLLSCSNHKQNRVDYQAFIAEHELKSVQRIRQFRMTRWQPLDDRFFIINASRNRNYLVQLMSHCPDLRHAHAIKLNQSMSHVLQSRFDSITVPKSLIPSCSIKTIYELSKEQKDALGKHNEVKVSSEVDL